MKVSEALKELGSVGKFDNISLLFYKWGIMPLEIVVECKDEKTGKKFPRTVKRLWDAEGLKRIGTKECGKEIKINNKDYLDAVKDSLKDSWLDSLKLTDSGNTVYRFQLLEVEKDLFDKAFSKVEKEIKLKIGYRLVIGMGYPSAVENGFLFHHTYGVPYIPGEALKGLTRFTLLFAMYSYLFRELSEKGYEISEKNLIETLDKCLTSGVKECSLKVVKDNVKKEKDLFELLKGKCLVWKDGAPEVGGCGNDSIEVLDLYEILFGSQKKRGEVIFFDAFPVELKKENFELDIMNPHYGDYYRESGKKPPADWYNPNPIIFLTLANVRFQFPLAFHPLNPLDESKSEKILETAEKLLIFALTTYGIGGKTRVGYGWFKDGS